MKKKIKLLEMANARIPGGHQPVNDTIKFQIVPQKQFDPPLPICRLSFDMLSKGSMPSDFALSFSLRYVVSEPKYDILVGDIGIPEIHLILEDGGYFSFKRGNIKDFFNLDKLTEYQTITLPLSWFSRNAFVSKGAESGSTPFSSNVAHLAFDFLRCPDTVLQVEMDNLQMLQIDRPLPPVTDFIDILHSSESPDQPIGLSFRDELSMRITLKEHVSSIADLRLDFRKKDNVLKSVQLRPGANYQKINLGKFGANEFILDLKNADTKFASSSLIVSRCRDLPLSKSKTTLGISDGANFNKAQLLGGQYIRRVCGLGSLFDKEGLPLNYLLAELKGTEENWIISIKAMPSYLSKKVPNSHRYGPNDFAIYEREIRELIRCLAPHKIFGIEAWNEANVIYEWQDDFEVLLNMQRILWEAVKLHSPSTLVLSPSTTSWDFDFFDKLNSVGILNYCDALAMHGYTYEPKNFVNLYDKLEAKLTAINFQKSVFITEIGFRTPAFSNIDQALYLCLFSIEAFVRDRIQAVLWFKYQNSRPESLTDYNQNYSAGYAMFGFQGVYSRPFVSTYVLLNKLFSEASGGSASQLGTVRQYNFNLLGEMAYAAYDETGLSKEKLPSEAGQTHLWIDIFGNQISEDSIVEQKLVFMLPDSIFNAD